MLSVKEAAEVIGVSTAYLVQIMEPDERRPSPTGGSHRLYYKKKSVESVKKKRIRQQKRNIKRQIERELVVPRPTDRHLTLTEASQYLGCAKGLIRHNVKSKIITKGTKAYRFYLPEDLLKMPANARPRPNGSAGRTIQRQCVECGIIFNSRNGERKCLGCLGFVDPDDEWGVRVRPRKRSKPCPYCSGVMFTGQTACYECRKLHPLGEVEDGFEYLSMSL